MGTRILNAEAHQYKLLSNNMIYIYIYIYIIALIVIYIPFITFMRVRFTVYTYLWLVDQDVIMIGAKRVASRSII
jgi:phosphate starvation-inducible membrane PsiE